MAALYRRNAERLGRTFPDLGPMVRRASGSTDMGNVSQAIPSIHPTIGLGCFPVVNHQPEFAAYCGTPVADQALIDGAVAMAWTAIDLANDRQFSRRLTEGAGP
jgi:metal-dependent amidase/aminoacylase/carboxypeptidase family protein